MLEAYLIGLQALKNDYIESDTYFVVNTAASGKVLPSCSSLSVYSVEGASSIIGMPKELIESFNPDTFFYKETDWPRGNMLLWRLYLASKLGSEMVVHDDFDDSNFIYASCTKVTDYLYDMRLKYFDESVMVEVLFDRFYVLKENYKKLSNLLNRFLKFNVQTLSKVNNKYIPYTELWRNAWLTVFAQGGLWVLNEPICGLPPADVVVQPTPDNIMIIKCNTDEGNGLKLRISADTEEYYSVSMCREIVKSNPKDFSEGREYASSIFTKLCDVWNKGGGTKQDDLNHDCRAFNAYKYPVYLTRIDSYRGLLVRVYLDDDKCDWIFSSPNKESCICSVRADNQELFKQALEPLLSSSEEESSSSNKLLDEVMDILKSETDLPNPMITKKVTERVLNIVTYKMKPKGLDALETSVMLYRSLNNGGIH